MTGLSRLAFNTLAFPGTTLARAASLGYEYGYQGIELRLIRGELIDPSMPATERTAIRQTIATVGLPIVAVDSSIRLTGSPATGNAPSSASSAAPSARARGSAVSG
jgi:hypothetical protein